MNILVIGAGPTGLMMAGELARHGVQCRIVDRNDGPAKESRALGVQARTLQIFESLGLADELVACGKPMYKGHVVIHGKELWELDFSEIPGKFNYILACPQNETERVLIERMNRQGVAIERGKEVSALIRGDDGVDVAFADGEEMRFDYVVGCDGSRSIVRKTLGLSFEGNEVAEGFILADLAIEWDRPEEMYLLAGEGGFLALFPLPNGRWRVIATAPADETGPVEFSAIEQMFKERSPYGGQVKDPAWISRFVIHERIVDRMREGRCFVVGDAAHLHSPAGGQGMNTGLQDAHNLAWKLALVARGVAKDRLLDTYQEERYPVDKAVVDVTRTLLHSMVLGGPVTAWVRDHVAPHIVSIPFIQRKLMKTVSEQTVGYGNSSIVGLGAGQWADVSDLPSGAKHLLVGRDADKMVSGDLVEICDARPTDEEVRLIRPDGYVAAVHLDPIESYFDKLGIDLTKA